MFYIKLIYRWESSGSIVKTIKEYLLLFERCLQYYIRDEKNQMVYHFFLSWKG